MASTLARIGSRLTIGVLVATAGIVALKTTAQPPAPLTSQAVPAAKRVALPIKPKRAPAPDSDAYVIKSILPIDGAMKIGDHYWDDSAAPAAGTIVITVDLAAQVLSVFRDGHEIGTSAILYGADAKPTPLGVYPITQKDADHHSNLYGNAPMPYMLRLTNDGVSIHGSQVEDGYMTHGCIGVPIVFAKKLFGVAKLGDKVIVTRGEMLDVGKPVTAA